MCNPPQRDKCPQCKLSYVVRRGNPVLLMAMKEEPPLAAECHDKFLIQSTTIVSEMETLSLFDMVSPLLSDALPVARKLSSEFPFPSSFRATLGLRGDDIVAHYRW